MIGAYKINVTSTSSVAIMNVFKTMKFKIPINQAFNALKNKINLRNLLFAKLSQPS